MSPSMRTTRATSVVLGLLLALSVLPLTAVADTSVDICEGAPTGTFRDVRPGSTHAAAIDCLAAYGITQGVGGGNYDPAGHVPREQMASFLANLLEVAFGGELPPPTSSAAFTDVHGVTHAANIVRIAELGIARGRTATSFDPRTAVTRAQMASFVARSMETAGYVWPATGPARFDDHVGSTHQESIDRLATTGVVRGIGGRSFDPAGHVTRAQMATFLINAAQRLADAGHWAGSLEEQLRPTIQLISRLGSTSDQVTIRWDRPVDVGVSVSPDQSITVRSEDETVVARSAALAGGHDRLDVTLDADLADGSIYWVEVAAGVVVDADGLANEMVVHGFTFAPATSGGSGGTAPSAPQITDVVTDPAGDRLVVTFDQSVTCPSGAAALASWEFTNNSVDEGGDRASGTPIALTQSSVPGPTCQLVYAEVGIADFGTLAFTQPADTDARVVNTSDLPLATVSGVRVRDGVAPELVGVTAHTGSTDISVGFTEPIACSTVGTGQLTVSVDGVASAIQTVGCAAPANSQLFVRLSTSLESGQQVVVTVAESTTLSDQSLDNRVLAGSVTGSAGVA